MIGGLLAAPTKIFLASTVGSGTQFTVLLGAIPPSFFFHVLVFCLFVCLFVLFFAQKIFSSFSNTFLISSAL